MVDASKQRTTSASHNFSSALGLVSMYWCMQAIAALAEWHHHGFGRARRKRLGQGTLERAHYEAVCRDAQQAAASKMNALLRGIM